MDRLVQNVGDLPTGARSAVEALMGHPLRDDQQLYILALDNASEPTVDDRRRAWDELSKTISAMREHAGESGVSSDDIERIIDEECNQVRDGKKPCE